MEHEQLSIERSQGRTAHGLQEAPVHFKPTYKYVPKKASVLDKSRAPAWCDRILFGSTGVIDAQVYSSVMSFTQSDHRPVYALLDITAPQDAASTLPTPFTPDNLRTPKLYLGDTFGLLVGALWSAVSLIGGGYDLAGVFVVGCSAIGFLAAYYMAIW